MNKHYSTILIVMVLVSLGFILSVKLTLLFLALWILMSLGAVGVAYYKNWAMLFRKKKNGSIPIAIRWVFFPFLTGVHIYNAFVRANDIQPPKQKITDRLFVGCRLTPRDVSTLEHSDINAVLDLTAEFDGLGSFADYDSSVEYLNIPVLDHMVPKPSQIDRACRWVEEKRNENKNVLIHCALGRGRAAFIASACLIYLKEARDTEDAMRCISETRVKARLNSRQLKALNDWQLHYQHLIKKNRKMVLIANPVAGKSEWINVKQDVIDYLSHNFDIEVYETSLSKHQSARALAEKAVSNGARFLIACGGDGTVREVASVAMKSDTTLGIVPLGTANALAHVFFGLESKFLPIHVACNAICDGATRSMDVAECNNEPMLLVAGFGIEESMINYANREQKLSLGQLAYVRGFLSALEVQTQEHLKMTLDNGEVKNISTKSLVVANAAPSTTLLAQGDGEPVFDDCLLDITWFDEQTSSSTYANVSSLALSVLTNAEPAKAVRHVRSTSVCIERGKKEHGDIHYVIDGEVRKAKSVEIRVLPELLNVFVPRRPLNYVSEAARAGHK